MQQRLRQLTEAECYARCYGRGSAWDAVRVVRVEREPRVSPVGADVLRLTFETKLDAYSPAPDAA
jgi:hypothetical protein